MKFSVTLSLFLFYSCVQPNQKGPTVQELIKSREIKQISDADILKEGAILGERLLVKVDSTIKMSKTACDRCFVNHLSYMKDSVAVTSYFDARTIQDEQEKQLFAAYQYSFENELPLSPAIQRKDKSTILYTAPIGDNNGLFRFCLDSCDRTSIDRTIPSLGMWSIAIPIKLIVNEMM